MTKFKNENVTGYLKSRTGTKKESPSKKTFNWRKILQFVTKFWKNTQNINNPGRWKGEKKTFSRFVVKKENRNIFSKKGESRECLKCRLSLKVFLAGRKRGKRREISIAALSSRDFSSFKIRLKGDSALPPCAISAKTKWHNLNKQTD